MKFRLKLIIISFFFPALLLPLKKEEQSLIDTHTKYKLFGLENLTKQEMYNVKGKYSFDASKFGFIGELFSFVGSNASSRIKNYWEQRALLKEEKILLQIRAKLREEIRMLKLEINKQTTKQKIMTG